MLPRSASHPSQMSPHLSLPPGDELCSGFSDMTTTATATAGIMMLAAYCVDLCYDV